MYYLHLIFYKTRQITSEQFANNFSFDKFYILIAKLLPRCLKIPNSHILVE